MGWPEGFVYDERDTAPKADRLPFVLQTDLPTLRVVIDPDTVLDADTAEYVDLIANHGPEVGVEVVQIITDLDAEDREGVWHLRRAEASANRFVAVRREGSGMRQVFLSDQFCEFVNLYSQRRHISLDQALRGHALHEVAREIGCHVFLTSSEPLFGFRRDGTMFACRPPDAMAMIGLYQRLRGYTVVRADGVRLLPPSWTYFLAVRAVLPELQRLAGLEAADLPQLPSRVRSLIVSASVRFERLLGDRDHLITQTLVAGRNVPFGSPAALTERIAMSLSGAFDSLARALNGFFDLGLPNSNQCSFTERTFRSRLPEEVKSAARDAEFQAMLRLTKLLRNTIHHEVLGEGVAIDQRRPGSRVPVAAIPEADAESVEAACRQLRKHGEWLLDLRDVVPDGTLMIRAPLVTEGLLRLGIHHCRQILSAAWPAAVDPAKHALQSSGWDRNPMLLSQTLKLHGLDHLDHARR